MKFIEPGHVYQLQNVERNGGVSFQEISFMQKEPVSEGSSELDIVRVGTTNEEVIAMMIDRFEYLQEKVPCKENEAALVALRQVAFLMEKRTQNRKERGVEGKRLE